MDVESLTGLCAEQCGSWHACDLVFFFLGQPSALSCPGTERLSQITNADGDDGTQDVTWAQ